MYVSFHVFFGTVKVDRILCDFGFGCHHELMYSVCAFVFVLMLVLMLVCVLDTESKLRSCELTFLSSSGEKNSK